MSQYSIQTHTQLVASPSSRFAALPFPVAQVYCAPCGSLLQREDQSVPSCCGLPGWGNTTALCEEDHYSLPEKQRPMMLAYCCSACWDYTPRAKDGVALVHSCPSKLSVSISISFFLSFHLSIYLSPSHSTPSITHYSVVLSLSFFLSCSCVYVLYSINTTLFNHNLLPPSSV